MRNRHAYWSSHTARVALASCLAVLACQEPTKPGPIPPSAPPEAERITVVVRDTIYTILPDGSAPRRIVRNAPLDNRVGSDLAWTSDRRWLLYAASSIGRAPFSLDVVFWDGTAHRTIIGTNAPVTSVAPSPDGTKVAYIVTLYSGAATVYTLHVCNVDGTGDRAIPVLRGPLNDVAWSPDGQWIAYSSGLTIQRLHPDGSGEETATSSAPSWTVAWASDGQQLAFAISHGVAIADLSGVSRRSYATVGYPHYLSWAIDSRRLVYTTTEDDLPYVLDTGTDTERPLPLGAISAQTTAVSALTWVR